VCLAIAVSGSWFGGVHDVRVLWAVAAVAASSALLLALVRFGPAADFACERS